ncbi:hypothetical protein GXP70_07265 [Paenibacillus lycopersici]|uniref:Uncharacterized protein n=1 Tax=Paenibacillus lycopersici TaxID=2704462 RepID=A0A6C0FWC8_9BACL|nr:hypothetical protein [Paenibacillus lycopersici]QHT59771.1 hypothetical protein GXP70_07265 [Paenibacillus lycopersici]
MARRRELLAQRIFMSGQTVPQDGVYGNLWGGWLPLLQGDRFPQHPGMDDTKWTYQGTLTAGLPQWKRADGKRWASDR